MFDMQKGKISVRREHCRWGVRKKPLVEMICCKKIVADEDEFQCVGHTQCEL